MSEEQAAMKKESFAHAVWTSDEMTGDQKAEWLWYSYKHLEDILRQAVYIVQLGKMATDAWYEFTDTDPGIVAEDIDRLMGMVTRFQDRFPELYYEGDWDKPPLPSGHPTIVCLCGSTRFSEAYQTANLEETVAGKIVLTIGCDLRSDNDLFRDMAPETLAALKRRLDELHLRKIDLADEVLILNVGGYIGESTRRELEYAQLRGKTIRFLEKPEDRSRE